jgi:hypothetical protein
MDYEYCYFIMQNDITPSPAIVTSTIHCQFRANSGRIRKPTHSALCYQSHKGDFDITKKLIKVLNDTNNTEFSNMFVPFNVAADIFNSNMRIKTTELAIDVFSWIRDRTTNQDTRTAAESQINEIKKEQRWAVYWNTGNGNRGTRGQQIRSKSKI